MYRPLNTYESVNIDLRGFTSNSDREDISVDVDDMGPLLLEADEKDHDKVKPDHHLSLREIIMLNMTYMGLNMMLLLLSVQIVPAQIEVMIGSAYKGIVLGCTIALGAISTFIVGPLIGMTSDRLTSKYGRRRPIIIICVTILCVSCLGMVVIAPSINPPQVNNGTNSSQCTRLNLTELRCKHVNQFSSLLLNTNSSKKDIPTNVKSRLWLYIPLYLIAITSYVATITPYNALIADKSHPDQRGLSSGAMAGMILFGNIVGAALGLLITPIGAIWTVSVGLIILILSVIITVTQTPEVPLEIADTSLTSQEKFKLFWLPFKNHDFRWLFITRFLLQQGLTSVIGFLEYWVKDMIELPLCWSTSRGVSTLLLPMLFSAAISSVISGIISDKINRRKMILIVTSIVMALVAAIMAALSGPNTYYPGILLAILFGSALGGYQAVDFALLLDIIPSEKDKSLMIAVWHQAMVLPQALAVPVAGLIVDLFERVNCKIGLGYIILMLLISTYFLLGGCLINKMKGAR